MADLFNNQPGIVAVLDTDGGDDNPFRVTLDNFPQIGAQSGVIFTELAIQRHGNFQAMHTLKDLVYVYSFGERIGQIRASGMAFARMCDGTEGLATILGYYENNRLDVRADPISIVIGTSDDGRFRGFLVELNIDVARPEARLAQFGMQFLSLPSAKPKAKSKSKKASGAAKDAADKAKADSEFVGPRPHEPPSIESLIGPGDTVSGGILGTKPGGMGGGVGGLVGGIGGGIAGPDGGISGGF